MMKKWCCPENGKDIGLLALRITVGIIFIYSGWSKLTNIDSVIGMFDGMGFPVAAFWAYLVAIVEFLGGLAVLLGVYTRNAALLLAVIMVVALLVAHTSGPFKSAIPALSLLGGSLALWGVGSGKYRLMPKQSDCVCKK